MPPIKTKGVASAGEVPTDTGSQPRTRKGVGRMDCLAKGVAEASAIFKMVGAPVRLNILLALVKGELSVGELCTVLGQSQPALSHHLALLRQGGLIAPRRQGKHNLYSLTDQGRQVAELSGKIEPGNRPTPTAVPIDPGLLEAVGAFVDDPEGWFRTPNPEFEGRRPFDLLGTSDEPRLRNRIEAAKLGMFS